MILADEAATQELGARLARQLRPGDVVTLSGPLGVGKTALARALVRALGHEGEVPSPSFAIVQPYDELDPPVWHVDLFRISDPLEMPELATDPRFKTPRLRRDNNDAMKDIMEGWLARFQTRDEAIKALRAAFHAAINDPEFLALAEKQKLEIDELPGDEVAGIIRSSFELPPDVIRGAAEATDVTTIER